MNKKISCIFVGFIFLVTTLSASGSILLIENDQHHIEDRDETLRCSDVLDGGRLEIRNEVEIIHLSGSNYEMGYQHGYLLKEKALQNFRAYVNFSKILGFCYDDFLSLWYEMKEFVPQAYIDEMQGLADATNMSLDDVAVGNIVTVYAHCSGWAGWGPATFDGRLIHVRSLDFPPIIIDPISKKFIQENQIIIIREPDNGYASMDPSFAGLVGSLGGFNEKSISTEVLTCWSNDEWHSGTPMIFRQRMILDHAATANEAIHIINSNRTCGWNFIISDGNNREGYAVEQTANHSYVGMWNDSTESTKPFFSIDHVVRRTNIFINAETAETQRNRYNPRMLPFLSLIFGKNLLGWGKIPSFIPWRHYIAVSKGINRVWGEMDLNNSMSMLREIYNGRTDFCFNIIEKLGLYTPLHQWVACPETGDMAISFASRFRNAHRNPVHYFNFYELLNAEP